MFGVLLWILVTVGVTYLAYITNRRWGLFLILCILLSPYVTLLILLISTLLPSLLIWNIYTDTHYTIFDDNRTLRVKSGFIINSRYDINKITRIRNTRTWLSSPALSIDRIEITFGRYNKVIISPLHKEAFINHLLSLNPDIQVEA